MAVSPQRRGARAAAHGRCWVQRREQVRVVATAAERGRQPAKQVLHAALRVGGRTARGTRHACVWCYGWVECEGVSEGVGGGVGGGW